MNQNNQLTEAEKKEVQEEKRVVFFEGNSWYHRTKELMDDLTTKYSKKVGLRLRKRQKKLLGIRGTLPGKTEGISSCFFKEQRSYVQRIPSVLV